MEIDGNRLPDEAEMLNVSPQERLAHYFQWLVQCHAMTIDKDYVRCLVEEGADTNLPYGSTMQRVLHEVAAHWDVAVAALLLEKRADVNSTDSGGRTPLHFAAYTNHTEMVAFLLDRGGVCVCVCVCVRACAQSCIIHNCLLVPLQHCWRPGLLTSRLQSIML